jgi:hypothetical protein
VLLGDGRGARREARLADPRLSREEAECTRSRRDGANETGQDLELPLPADEDAAGVRNHPHRAYYSERCGRRAMATPLPSQLFSDDALPRNSGCYARTAGRGQVAGIGTSPGEGDCTMRRLLRWLSAAALLASVHVGCSADSASDAITTSGDAGSLSPGLDGGGAGGGDGSVVLGDDAAPVVTTDGAVPDASDADAQVVAPGTQLPSMVILTSTPNPSVSGEQLSVTAVVTGQTAVPTGTVTFNDGPDVIGTATLNAASEATIGVANGLPTGIHTLTATYGGDTRYLPGTSGPLAHTVDKAATSVVVTPSSNPALSGQSLTLTATVTITAPGNGIPSGSITFLDGATTLGTSTLNGSQATFSTAALSLGTHSITAKYAGTSQLKEATSLALEQTIIASGASLALTSSKNPSVSGDSVTFTATLAGSSGVPTGTVTFSEGAIVLGTSSISGSTAVLSTSTLKAGAHTITATYGGNGTYSAGASSSVVQSVSGAPTTTALGSTPNPSDATASITLAAAVNSNVPGTITGTVTFMDGTSTLGTGTVTGGIATFATTSLAAGTHTLTATFGGDLNYAGSSSPSVSQVVKAIPTQIAVKAAPLKPTSSETVTLVTKVAPVAATGTVTFKDGSTTLGTATLSGGFATLSAGPFTVGPHGITAVYSGDAIYASSTSDALPLTVRCTPTALFGTPVNVAELNSGDNEFSATLSADELTVYLSSINRAGSVGGVDMYVATRGAKTDPFGTPTLVTPPNTKYNDLEPMLSADGLALYFTHEDNTTGAAPANLWIAQRSSVADPFPAGTKIAGIDTATASVKDIEPYVVGSGLYFASSRSGVFDLYYAAAPNLTLPTEVPGVNSATASDFAPVVSPDELTIYFASDRPNGKGQADVWMATRASPAVAFSNVTALTSVNSSSLDYPTWISPDSCTLYLVSDRPGTHGGRDIWRATKP